MGWGRRDGLEGVDWEGVEKFVGENEGGFGRVWGFIVRLFGRRMIEEGEEGGKKGGGVGYH